MMTVETEKYDYNNGLKKVKEASQTFPKGSGVYKFLDSYKNPLYIGKAKNLKKRISSYLNIGKHTKRTKILISLTQTIIFIKTPTEIDSFILESNLIKSFKPKFNIRFRDDKSYPFIMIDERSKWPRIRKIRGKHLKKDFLFGPFANSRAVDEDLTQLEKAFLLRSCSDNIFNSRTRPCILYQIKRCSAPCTNLIKKNDYKELVDNAILFLKGKDSLIKENLINQMKVESKSQNYETATILRDRIKALTKISQEKYSDLNNDENFDIVCCIKNFDEFCVQIFFFRSGKNLGNKEFFFKESISNDAKEVLSQFLIIFYSSNLAPKIVYINQRIKKKITLSSILSKNKRFKVEIKVPSRGKKMSLLRMVESNIIASLKDKLKSEQKNLGLLKSLAKSLKLKKFPNRIEIYDNSHLSGTDPVGAMVVYENFSFQKKKYKKFNIKSTKSILNDDYFMLTQVINRRFTLNNKWKSEKPDLLIIDGGKGHLNSVLKVLKNKNIEDIDLISIAKGKRRIVGDEKIFTLNGLVKFNKSNEEFFLLQRLRDEAHRFAVSSQRVKRLMSIKNSIFDKIGGVGRKNRSKLLSYFGSIENIKTASIDDLKKTPGIGKKIARKIYEEFNKIV